MDVWTGDKLGTFSSMCRSSSTAGSISGPPRLQRTVAASTYRDSSRCSLAAAKSVSHCHARPGRRRLALKPHAANVSTIVSVLLFVVFCCSSCVAAAIPNEQDWANTGNLLFDRSAPPEPPMRLIRRAEVHSSKTTSATKSSSSTASTTSDTATALPSAFDSSLGNNFTTSSCPTFFRTFLSNDTFNDCVPLSLLLQTSTSFFTIQRSPVRLAQTLSASCSVNFTQCSAVMASLAREIQLSENCGADLAAQNPMVVEAYDGLVAYQPLYEAGCLENSNTGSYCFSDAVTNSSSPTDSYVYYLPLGVSLPDSTSPSCSACLRNTMSVFASAATNSSQPVSKVYADAAQMIDQTCGAEFVNASIPHTSSAVSMPGHANGGFGGLGLLAFAISVMVILA